MLILFYVVAVAAVFSLAYKLQPAFIFIHGPGMAGLSDNILQKIILMFSVSNIVCINLSCFSLLAIIKSTLITILILIVTVLILYIYIQRNCDLKEWHKL